MTVRYPVVEVHYLPARGRPPPPRVLEGIDQETGRRWLVVIVWLAMWSFPPPANDNRDIAKRAAA